MSAAFDTLRLARSLRDKAHFSPEQAEGLADAIAEAMRGDLATKADLNKWVVGMIGLQTVVLLGAAPALVGEGSRECHAKPSAAALAGDVREGGLPSVDVPELVRREIGIPRNAQVIEPRRCLVDAVEDISTTSVHV